MAAARWFFLVILGVVLENGYNYPYPDVAASETEDDIIILKSEPFIVKETVEYVANPAAKEDNEGTNVTATKESIDINISEKENTTENETNIVEKETKNEIEITEEEKNITEEVKTEETDPTTVTTELTIPPKPKTSESKKSANEDVNYKKASSFKLNFGGVRPDDVKKFNAGKQ